MTRDETKKLLMIMSAVYPNWKASGGERFAVDVWQVFLENYDFADIEKAFKAYVTTNKTGFAPDVGKLIQMVNELKNGVQMSDMEAWGLVKEAICDGIYHAEERFAELPPLVQKAIGGHSLIREWATSDIKSIETVIQSNFLKCYRAEKERQADLATYSPDVLEMVNRTSQKLIG